MLKREGGMWREPALRTSRVMAPHLVKSKPIKPN